MVNQNMRMNVYPQYYCKVNGCYAFPDPCVGCPLNKMSDAKKFDERGVYEKIIYSFDVSSDKTLLLQDILNIVREETKNCGAKHEY